MTATYFSSTASRSSLSKILPLLVLLFAVVVFTFISYHLYLTIQKIFSTTSEKMQTKNIFFSKDGMKVGIKELKNEKYVDASQSILVKAWNLSK
ncbi:hypothetical protein GcM3_108016 [Golovinomyces cichoracearum]|uniref:Uncharacterized protein n=1 Tax=Golovinomyces cichoracearum TaxID=62708 RepID=A0A420I9D4_9PEZI|nr:hypothetical protein GcM3_108016 [Golovinomyces cichoracearum]